MYLPFSIHSVFFLFWQFKVFYIHFYMYICTWCMFRFRNSSRQYCLYHEVKGSTDTMLFIYLTFSCNIIIYYDLDDVSMGVINVNGCALNVLTVQYLFVFFCVANSSPAVKSPFMLMLISIVNIIKLVSQLMELERIGDKSKLVVPFIFYSGHVFWYK